MLHPWVWGMLPYVPGWVWGCCLCTRVGMVGMYPYYAPGWVWWVYSPPYYAHTLHSRVYHGAHPTHCPSHPAAHGVRVRGDEALGSRRGITVGESLSGP